MKLSRFNFFKNFNDTMIFFNAMTCALAVVDKNFWQVIEDIKKGAYNEEKYSASLISDMKESGCIIEDNVDELKRLEFFRNVAKYDLTSLALTVAPTLDCNFRCKYCFETHPKGIMNEEIQNALVGFVEKRLSVAKNFSVTWYGGEPLLAKNIIFNLSEKFLELCKKTDIAYDSFIITNASLIGDTDIENFKKYKIFGTQITIDGPKKIHDDRRRSVKNESTFDKLIDVLNELLNNDLTAICRINIDRENINFVDELLETLRRKIKRYRDLKIDFGQVTPFTDICRSIESNCYDNKQYADIMLPLYAKVHQFGFEVNKMSVYPSPRVNFCCYDYANAFVVDNFGELYRCWNHVGNTKKSCGNVKNFDNDKLESNYITAIQWNPIVNEKCRNCKILPICMGGCPDAMNNSADGQPVCGTVKYNLDKIIEYYYEQLKGEVEE